MARINEHGIKSTLSTKLRDIPMGQLASLAIFLTSTLAAGQSEPHGWLGSSPTMKEWIGKRMWQAPEAFDFAIKNKKFIADGLMPLDFLNNDKTNEAKLWIDDFYSALPLQIEELIATLINNGETATCFDGQAFFDTDHSYGKSGNFSNDISGAAASASAATVEEMALAINKAIETMRGFPNDQGKMIANRGMTEVDVICKAGTVNSAAIRAAISAGKVDTGAGSVDNPLIGQDVKINLNVDGLITLADTKFVVARSRRSDVRAKPFAFQENRDELRIDVLDDSNAKQFVVENDAVGIALKMVGNGGYGLPSHAILVTMA